MRMYRFSIKINVRSKKQIQLNCRVVGRHHFEFILAKNNARFDLIIWHFNVEIYACDI